MAPHRWQGKRLDGAPYEIPSLDHREFTVTSARATRSNKRTTLDQRQPGIDFDEKWYDDRDARGAFGDDSGSPLVRPFLSQGLFFHENDAEDTEWGPIRPLGAGSYGKVGLFQKRNLKNEIVDEIVCKEMQQLSADDVDAFEVDHTSGHRLLNEAAIHRDINVGHPGVSPHLRRYKFLQDNAVEGRYRFYVEYCPYGTMDRIYRLYRCWNTFLPEAYIWHVFHDLAKACEALRDSPPTDSKMLEVTPNTQHDLTAIRDKLFCLHGDMKPANFLLGYPHEGEEYPSTLMNDFGLSVYTSYSGMGTAENPTQCWWRHSIGYGAPEQVHYGANWPIPPDGGWVRSHGLDGFALSTEEAKTQREEDNQDTTGDVRIIHTLNVYSIAQTLFRVLVLGAEAKQVENCRATYFDEYRRRGDHQLEEIDTAELPGFYSSKLRDLIRQCLDPNPARRPTQLELMDRTNRGLRKALKRAKTRPRVYFRGNEINEMSLGNAKFNATLNDFTSLVESQFVDPDLPMLKLPTAKYGDLSQEIQAVTWKRLYNKTNSHRRWFRPVGAPSSTPAGDEDDDDDDADDDQSRGRGGGAGNRAGAPRGGGKSLPGVGAAQGQGAQRIATQPQQPQHAPVRQLAELLADIRDLNPNHLPVYLAQANGDVLAAEAHFRSDRADADRQVEDLLRSVRGGAGAHVSAPRGHTVDEADQETGQENTRIRGSGSGQSRNSKNSKRKADSQADGKANSQATKKPKQANKGRPQKPSAADYT